MTVSVQYACPHCGALTTVDRSVELADRSITLSPQPGWEYATPDDPGLEDADGIAFVCGEHRPVTDRSGDRADGCGRPFYLNFVRFRRGIELDPDPPAYDGPRFDFLG